MSDANRVQVSLVEEATWGITPNSAFVELPLVSGSLGAGASFIRSAQMRSDAQLAGSKLVGFQPSASVEFEMQGDNFDTLIRAMLRNASTADWSTAVNISGSGISVSSVDNSYNGASGMNTNVTVGQWVFAAGFSTAANNGWGKVVSATATKMIVEGITLTTESAGASVTIKGSVIRNGTDSPSFSMQAERLDLTNKFDLLTGAMFTSADLKIALGAIIKANAGWEGKQVTLPTAKSGNGSVTAAAANDVMAEVTAFSGFWVDDTPVTAYYLTDVGVKLANKARAQRALGQSVPIGMKLGPLEVNGNLGVYQDNNTFALKTKLLAGTSFSLGWAITDGAGNMYHFDLPKCYFTGEPGQIPGNDSDMMFNFDFAAEPAALGSATKTIQISRLT